MLLACAQDQQALAGAQTNSLRYATLYFLLLRDLSPGGTVNVEAD
ncbi:MAG TPA: hypothetical protein VJ124_04750 [Pyrinomonadaceae bacterium]|nr:hypothetical protein [Pyrinomonadaceae bacterium]